MSPLGSGVFVATVARRWTDARLALDLERFGRLHHLAVVATVSPLGSGVFVATVARRWTDARFALDLEGLGRLHHLAVVATVSPPLGSGGYVWS